MDLARNGFTHDAVKLVLHSPNRQIDFRYELLDKENRKKRDLSNVTEAKIDQSMLAQIKRTAQFNIIEDGQPIDYLNDRIKPYMRLWMPKGRVIAREYAFFSHVQPMILNQIVGNENSGWIDFPLGVFLLSTPTRKDELASVHREIEAYDLSLILRDDKFLDRHTIVEGTNYYDAIIAILRSSGIYYYNIEQTTKNLPRTIEFDPGTEKLEAINELLSQLNYTPLFVDEEGYFVSRAYISPSERSADYAYIDDEQSVTLIGAEEELDTFNVPNIFTVVRSNEEEWPLTSTYTNNNPNSPLSTVNRGRNIVDFREITDIADQAALDAYVQRIAFEASQIYGRIQFKSALMPMHGYGDVLQMRYQNLKIDGKYLELNWSMDLVVGGKMSHELRQVVTL
ncbi:hypothetical protein [Psychrobacillus sp. BM2]|uniref:hypothetical protein n=1 Tax=Psychrobacillus sp. BM2 TaxID=3400421 RepID=UPI003B022AC0